MDYQVAIAGAAAGVIAVLGAGLKRLLVPALEHAVTYYYQSGGDHYGCVVVITSGGVEVRGSQSCHHVTVNNYYNY